MEEMIKKAIAVGNSAGVRVPRTWLNKEVKVVLLGKNNQTILKDVIEILNIKGIKMENIININLVGSYARKEETMTSDIDILIITENIDDNIYMDDYHLMLVSTNLLSQKMKNDIFPIMPMIKEAAPLLNKHALKEYENMKITKKNIKWYLDTTDSALEINKSEIEFSEINKSDTSHSTAYSLILRLRTLYLISNLIKSKKSTNKELKSIIKKVSNSMKAYEMYLESKSKNKSKKTLPLGEAKKLLCYIQKENDKLKKFNKIA